MNPSITTGIEGSGIEGIDAITYSTDGTPKNWDDTRRFFADWGLTPLVDDAEKQVWETLNGAQVIVRQPDDASLPPAMESGPTLREVVWGVKDDATLQKLAGIIAKSGIKSASNPITASAGSYKNNSKNDVPQVRLIDPHGLSIVFQKSAKRVLNIQGALTNPYGNTQRVDAPSPVYERATPVDIGHVVLFTDVINEAEAFYQQLGFVTSDRYPGRGVFMRCAPEAGHHDLFLLQIPNKAKGLNHVAFTVRDIHEVFGGGLHMSRCGWKTQLGPGRHPISSAYFWYFENPCGGLIEYNADEDKLTEKWQAREFEPGPTVFAEWAIDGGIDGNTRRQPNVAAASAFLTEKK
jgi:catechol 2,3-dioxygenase-like lactoylglutathione lyase family enzyme